MIMRQFYLSIQGFAKPIYAIPGITDWFDALALLALRSYAYIKIVC